MESEFFSLEDYDCIGFDLDCTLVEYNYKELVKLVYDLLVDYLVEKKSYEKQIFKGSIENQNYFLQKGLFVDLKKGNVLKINKNGEIVMATHGTAPMTQEQIIASYGAKNSWDLLGQFIQDPLSFLNTPLEKKARTTLDCFDMVCSIIFARIVDHLDDKIGRTSEEYDIWPDILGGLYHLYNRNHFASGEGGFFSSLKSEPNLFLKKWTPEKVAWLKKLKSKKFVFLLTGSFVDFASFTAGFCIGESWRECFDVLVCYARKPFFFTCRRPFLSLPEETETVDVKDFKENGVYSQGNWEQLKLYIAKKTSVEEPKCLYIGDNLIQDVYSPVKFNCCHSVAVCPELKGEFEFSPLWGSYFSNEDGSPSFWNQLIRSHAKICVASLDVFLKNPLGFQYRSLQGARTNDQEEINGYFVG